MKRFILLFVALVLCSVTGLQLARTGQAAAVTGAEWQAGRIIDDNLFQDSSSMNVTQIQQFIASKVPSCDTYGQQTVNGMTRAAYAASKGNPAPSGQQVFTCLQNYYEVPKTAPGPAVPASNYGWASGHIPAGAESAAQLILDAAQKYQISPKVLLVTLEKEQGLVSDDWPFNSQYLYAMGADCPDGPNGADCDPNYAGFSLQMMEGASLFRSYLNDMTQPWWTYKKPYQNNSILYNVTSTNCGSKNVYISTEATAALYTYTPYQPNQAALTNLYGTGDNCSAYGNRNFWRQYNDWFGTTLGSLFQLAAIYHDLPPTLIPGQSQNYAVQFRNDGQWIMHDTTENWPGIPPLILASSIGNSPFSYTWAARNVPLTNFSKVYEANGTTLAANQHEVAPGQVVEYDFNMTAPWAIQTGNYYQEFRPVLFGTTTDLGSISVIQTSVAIPSNFAATAVSQSADHTLAPGQSQAESFKYRNSGQWIWHDSTENWPGIPAVSLTSNVPTMYSYGWPNSRTPATTFTKVYQADGTTLALNQHEASPGQIVEFDFNVTAPWIVSPGTYPLSFSPVLPPSGAFPSTTATSTIKVTIPMWRANAVSQNTPASVADGSATLVALKYQNTGAWAWHDKTINWPGIAPLVLNSSAASMFSYGWPSSTQAANVFTKVYEADGVTLAANQHLVNPWQIVEFDFNAVAPWTAPAGNYPQTFYPNVDGANIGAGATVTINVQG